MALLGFQGFYEEAKAKDKEKKKAKELAAGAEKVGPEAEAPKEKEGEEVEKRFVKLDGMAGKGQAPIGRMAKNNRPRDVGRRAENFLIDEIAEANEGAGQGRWNRDEIEQAKPSQGGIGGADTVAKKEKGNEDAEGRPMARKPPFPNAENLDGIG